MRRKFVLSAWALAALAAFGAGRAAAEVTARQWEFRGGDPAGRAAYFAQSHRFWGSNVYPGDPAFLGKMVTLATGKTEFLLWFSGKVDPKANEWRATVGMGRPSKANWYENSFYAVRIGKKFGSEFRTELLEAKGGEQGEVVLKWAHAEGGITTKFILLDGDDKLLIETSVQAAKGVKSYSVQLTCYPSSFAGGYSSGVKTRDREALTPKRILVRLAMENNAGSVNADLAKDEPWVLLYDKYFDPALNRGDGPCAFAYAPQEAAAARVSVQNYGCVATLGYPADKTAHVIVWDFRGMSNKAAMDYMGRLTIE